MGLCRGSAEIGVWNSSLGALNMHPTLRAGDLYTSLELTNWIRSLLTGSVLNESHVFLTAIYERDYYFQDGDKETETQRY